MVGVVLLCQLQGQGATGGTGQGGTGYRSSGGQRGAHEWRCGQGRGRGSGATQRVAAYTCLRPSLRPLPSRPTLATR